MLFRNPASARGVRLGACVILLAMSALVAEELPALGLLLFVVGLGGAGYYSVLLFRERRDRYDLSRLWEQPPDEPEPDERYEQNMIYCHRCGASMSQFHSICPGCGATL